MEESHPWPQRLPLDIAVLIASVSSVVPSPETDQVQSWLEWGLSLPAAPKSLTFRKTL